MNFVILLVVVVGVFDVPMRGSYALLLALSGLFIVAEVGVGLLISAISRSQQQAVLLVFPLAMVDLALSGYLVPVETMPRGLQVLSFFTPLRHYMKILEGHHAQRRRHQHPVAQRAGPGRPGAGRGPAGPAQRGPQLRMNADQIVIQTDSLSRRFGQVLAVDGLVLAVLRGEIFGLVGPDGAGKTTTLRMLAAIMDPSSGHATVAGFDTVRQPAAIKRRIGYMAQQFTLYGDLSVQENLDFYADIFGVRGRERRERRARLLHFARLTEFKQRRAGALSGGMKKKLALACALIHQPDILYLDEPTTGVDPVARREFWDILSDLHAQGVTILISTPYMDEAERCSRVGLMYGGRLVMCDTPERIKQEVNGELVELRPVAVTDGALTGIGLLRQAETATGNLAGVLEVQTYGDLLHIFVDNAALRMPQIEAALAAQGIAAAALRPTQPRMEEAFTSLIRRQENITRNT